MSSRAFNPTRAAGLCPTCGVMFAPNAGRAFFKTMKGSLALGERFDSSRHIEFEPGTVLDADGNIKTDRNGNAEKERDAQNNIVYRNVLNGDILPIRQVADEQATEAQKPKRVYRYGRWQSIKPTVYKWQEMINGEWRDVSSFDHMMHVDCAVSHGFSGPTGETTAYNGTRVVGHGHRVN